MDIGDLNFSHIMVLIISILAGYLALRGIGQLLNRYNPILVIIYFYFFFSVAIFHAFLLEIFGKSTDVRTALVNGILKLSCDSLFVPYQTKKHSMILV